MTYKHTPAPWVMKDNFIESIDGYWICALDEDSQHKIDYAETEQANARLIAAAPELLEVLEDLLQAWKGEQVFTFDHWYDAEKAIKKAKGEV